MDRVTARTPSCWLLPRGVREGPRRWRPPEHQEAERQPTQNPNAQYSWNVKRVALGANGNGGESLKKPEIQVSASLTVAPASLQSATTLTLNPKP